MAEYDANGNEIEVEETEEKSFWELMNETEPDDDDEYEDEQDEQDEEIAKSDKLDKKLSAKFDAREKKFEHIMLKDRVGKYQETATELEQSLFKAIASDVKTMADFDRATEAIARRAKKMEAAEAEYRQQMEARASQQAAAGWGTGPIGVPAAKTKDYDKELLEKIESGDTHSLLVDLIGQDAPWLAP
jgi:hypothetical protein